MALEAFSEPVGERCHERQQEHADKEEPDPAEEEYPHGDLPPPARVCASDGSGVRRPLHDAVVHRGRPHAAPHVGAHRHSPPRVPPPDERVDLVPGG